MKMKAKEAKRYFLSFAGAATPEQLYRFVEVLSNRPEYKVPVSLVTLVGWVNRELIARTEWSV